MNFSTSLICTNLVDVKSDIDQILSHGEDFKWLHADFMDGHFVPRYGISPELIQSIRKRYGKNVVIDSHLMVSDAYTYMDVIAPYSDWFFFHIESATDPTRTCQMLRKKYPELKIGFTVNLLTSLSAVKCANILGLIDGVMFMGISPGVLGINSYPEIVTDKIKEMSLSGLSIFVDGSVNFKTIPVYNKYGAKTLVCGSSTIFKIDDETRDLDRKSLIDYNIKRIQSCLKQS